MNYSVRNRNARENLTYRVRETGRNNINTPGSSTRPGRDHQQVVAVAAVLNITAVVLVTPFILTGVFFSLDVTI